MSSSASAALLSVCLFLGMAGCLEAGYRAGVRHGRVVPTAHEGVGALEAAIFALLGLLLGFAFAGATSRLDARRQLIVAEANAIGTAYLRLDLLTPADQPDIRRLFRSYLDARLHAYQDVTDADATDRAIVKAQMIQEQIWDRAIAASRLDQTQNLARVLLPALNEMIDVATARRVALRTSLPPLIFALLITVALLSALLGGYAMAKRQSRSVVHMAIFAAAVSITIYVVVDLDNPRMGLIRLNTTERILQDLHDSIR